MYNSQKHVHARIKRSEILKFAKRYAYLHNNQDIHGVIVLAKSTRNETIVVGIHNR